MVDDGTVGEAGTAEPDTDGNEDGSDEDGTETGEDTGTDGGPDTGKPQDEEGLGAYLG